MSKPSEEQKTALHQHFAKKTSSRNPLITDADAVERRRRIEVLEEQWRFELEFAL